MTDSNFTPVAVNCRSVIEYSPKLLKYTTSYRPWVSFLAIKKGEYVYKTENGEITVREGEVLFLPKGTAYTYNVVSEETLTQQVTFDICPDEANRYFPRAITKVEASAAVKIFSAFPSLLKAYRSSGTDSYFEVSSIIFRFLSLLIKQTKPQPYSRAIMPAITFLEQNFNGDFSVASLSELCNISESQLRRLFVRETSMSPLKFKNSLRVAEACKYLESEEFSITEISEIMQFETPYSFSKFFKNEMGVSPHKYSSLHKKGRN